ncbi:MAG: PAS domain-containing sensor histidine kinase [Candidatus Obscuribacterales bacterium]|nr:PAS domain-containing sensor histidine kinase [Candidatus Obscuribacterales bacterium]
MRTIHKGILLVAVPFLFEILFIAGLWYCLQIANQQVEDILRLHKITEHIARIEQLFKSDCMGLAAFVVQSGSDDSLKGLVDEKHSDTTINEEFLQLRKLVRGNPVDVKDLIEFEADYENFTEMINHMKTGVIGRREMSDKDKVMSYLQADERVNEFTKHSLGFFERQKSAAEAIKLQNEEMRRTVSYMLITGLVINAVIAAGLVAYFTLSIQRRVRAVVENNIRFAAGQALFPPIDGRDEIAEMDRAFHAMARTVDESRQKEQAILKNAVDIVCTMDDAGRVTQANPALLHALGGDEDDILGKHLFDCVADSEKRMLIDNLRIASENSHESHRFEVGLMDREGFKRDFLWSVNYNDSYKTYFCVASDITQRKALDKMKQEFVAMASHDLRSPLTSMLATFDLLSTGIFGTLNSKGTARIDMAKISIRRLVSLINDLLDLDKLESGGIEIEVRPVNVDSILELSAETLRGMAEQNDVNVVVEGSSLHIMADEDRLVQVLTNLLSNAIKFSPSCSTIKLHCHMVQGGCQFRVDDQGRGIPAEKLDQIFERFKQVSLEDSKGHKGSGLGLAICKAIVEAHGGSIGVDSTVDSGSSFWFTLPCEKLQE